jgi:signal peptidase I
VFLLYYLIIFYVLLSISLYFLFPKAGVEAKKGLIPGVNFYEWAKLIGKKPIAALWLLFPIVNIFTFCAMAVDLVRSFGKHEFKHSAAAVLFAPGIFYKIAKNDKDKYEGPILTKEADYMTQLQEARKSNDKYKLANLEKNNPFKKPVIREWTESIIFAVFAAAFIRMFLIEAYVIPTSSMEGSLNVGDYLFVSKAHYGIRTPQTIAMFPLLHNTLPFFGTESYLSKPSLGYHRLPAIEKIEAGKPIVFNWPVGDSVYFTGDRSIYVGQVPQFLRNNHSALQREIREKDLRVRPVDKKDHYVKRCVAAAGDTLQIKDGQIFIDGKMQKNPTYIQYQYYVNVPQNFNLNPKKLSEWGISEEDLQIATNNYLLLIDSAIYNSIPSPKKETLQEVSGLIAKEAGKKYYETDLTDANFIKTYRQYFTPVLTLTLNNEQLEKLKTLDKSISFVKKVDRNSDESIFPHAPKIYPWTVDNYGPIYIPKKGASIKVTNETLPLYWRLIKVYENNTLEQKNGKIFINGKEATEYIVRQNYYWAMGDNRHGSEDSRFWGFVPEDHIVGKPLFIWFSTKEGNMKKGINWDRIFTSAAKP